MDALTLLELRQLCRRRGLHASGAKSELIERLLVSSKERTSSIARILEPSRASPCTTLFPTDYTTLSMPELQELCQKRSLAVGGLRAELVARLRRSDPRHARRGELVGWCRHAGLSSVGTTAELVERVMVGMAAGADAKETILKRSAPDTRCERDAVGQDDIGCFRPATASPATSNEEPTLAQLKEQCRTRMLTVSGSRADLIHRLEQHAATGGHQPRRSVAAPPTEPRSVGAKRKASVEETASTQKQAKTMETRVAVPSSEGTQRTHRIAVESFRPRSPSQEACDSSPIHGCYVVVTLHRSPSAPARTQQQQVDRVFTTKAAANTRVRAIFYGSHPDKWTQQQFESYEQAIRVDYEDELLALSVEWQRQSWIVQVVHVADCPRLIASSKEGYVVCTALADRRLSDPPELRVSGIHTTREAANVDAECIYLQKKPVEASDGHDAGRDVHDGRLSFSVLTDTLERRVQVCLLEAGELETSPVSEVEAHSQTEIARSCGVRQHNLQPSGGFAGGDRCVLPRPTPDVKGEARHDYRTSVSSLHQNHRSRSVARTALKPRRPGSGMFDRQDASARRSQSVKTEAIEAQRITSSLAPAQTRAKNLAVVVIDDDDDDDNDRNPDQDASAGDGSTTESDEEYYARAAWA